MSNNISNKVRDTGSILLALGTIGFIGIVLLVLYGNMSPSFVQPRLTATVTNQSGYAVNDTIYTLTSFTNTAGAVSVAVTSVFNATNGTAGFPLLLNSGNYTVNTATGTITGASGRTANYTVVNVSYTVSYQNTPELNANLVSNNITQGTVTFFGFSNTFFTFSAIVILFTLFGILLRMVSGFGKQSGSKFSE